MRKEYLESLLNSDGISVYPETDISYDNDSKVTFIEIAVAGFERNELDVEVKDGRLVVKGTPEGEDSENMIYTQRHITKKAFTRIIALSKNYANGEVYADLENGILTISIAPTETPSNKIQIN